MDINEEILRPRKNIRGGIRLPHRKNTAETATVIMPPPEKVVIPMQQHIGAPCEPTVAKGDTVFVGTLIGDSQKYVSAPIHSSVSGTVTAITEVLQTSGQKCTAIEITSDGLMTPDPSLAPITVTTPGSLIKAARDCGLVGLGGAGFPAHVKLNVRAGSMPDTLIINGAECEPYITADYRECMENPTDILEGIYLIKRIMGIKNVIIAVENNKPKAIETLLKMAADDRDLNNEVKLMRLKSSYPQGAEKVLIYTATGRKLPLGKLPADVGCIVMNITSVSTLYKYIKTGMPLVSRTMTVDGGGVKEPKNVKVPFGTSIKDLLDFCGGITPDTKKILLGGPMMGMAAPDLSMPLCKYNNAVLVFNRRQVEKPGRETACIRCGRCAAACPMGLQPLEIEPAVRKNNVDRIAELNVMYCMECGSCAFSCPSRRPLTQIMRLAKAEMKARQGGK